MCQDDGTRLLTYTGSTNSVPSTGPGHVAKLTVGEIRPTGTQVSPETQTVVGNTTFTFTQTVPGDALSAQATAFLVWGDKVKSDPIGKATFTTNCKPPVVPAKPAPKVVVTHSDAKDCVAKKITTTTVTTTTDWTLVNNKWTENKPVETRKVTTRPTTAQECPVVVTPKPAPVVVPPKPAPVVAVPESVVVLGTSAAVNPLPMAAAAGEANSSNQLVSGGVTALAAFLALGAGFVLRRRDGDI